LDSPTTLDFWIRVGLVVLIGGTVGLERQLRGKPIGIRTSVLIVLGSMLFIRLGHTLVGGVSGGDPTRVLGQLVTGVGFLGAGVIMTTGGAVRGMTSAAVVWTLAALGSAVGLDRWLEALVYLAITMFLLVIVAWLERRLVALRKGVHADSLEHRADAAVQADTAPPR